MAEDTPLIILFILLGLGFLGGGAAAIIDGLPYLVLERGFTQVIIGTVVAVAGVILLALAQVLAKLRALENRLSGTAMALSLAGAAGVAAREPGEPSAPAPSPASPAGLAPGAAAPSAAVAVAGALAGAGLAGASLGGAGLAGAAAADADRAEPEPAARPDEPDLFGAHLASVLGTPAAEPRETDAEAAEPPQAVSKSEAGPDEGVAQTIEPETLPAFDPFRPIDPEFAPLPAAFEGDDLAVPLPARDGLPPLPEANEDTADASVDVAEPEPDAARRALPPASDIDDPLTPAAPPATAADDEFDRLRESLAGLGLGPIGGRVEPRFDEPGRPPAGPDDLAAAASWMDSALGRRPTDFETPAGVEVEPPPRRLEPTLSADLSWPILDRDDRSVPAWPPQTQQATAIEPVADADPGLPETAQSEPEIEPAAAPVEPAPAASEEGIVGAYQVGEAHFTIYADGSIKARTPDGDYSFASMDELKVYLASEKSRLGS
jgi:hypothetical protein